MFVVSNLSTSDMFENCKSSKMNYFSIAVMWSGRDLVCGALNCYAGGLGSIYSATSPRKAMGSQ